MLSLGRSRTITSEDLWNLFPGDDAETSCNVFAAHSDGHPNTVRGLLVKCLLAVRPCLIRQFSYAFFGTFLFFTVSTIESILHSLTRHGSISRLFTLGDPSIVLGSIFSISNLALFAKSGRETTLYGCRRCSGHVTRFKHMLLM
jgi:hypothetical protein